MVVWLVAFMVSCTVYLEVVIISFFIYFRAVARTRAEQNVQAEVEIVFSEKSTEPIPSSTSIVETLKEAATNPNSGFNITVDANTISVISKSSQSMYSYLICPIAMKCTMLTCLENSVQYVISFQIVFVESLQIIPVTILTNGTFAAALSITTSPEFKNRATMIKTGVGVTRLLFLVISANMLVPI